MAKKKDVQLASSETGLADIKYTNRLLYNLSKYPHAKKSKRLVREGLFDFEENNVFRASKAKK